MPLALLSPSVPSFSVQPRTLNLELLIPVMRKCSICLGHFVGVFAALDRGAYVVRGVHQLRGEAVRHALATSLAGGAQQPAYCKREAAVTLDLDRHLIGGTTHAAGL